MLLSSWLNSLTSVFPVSRPRPRKNAARNLPLEALEQRTLLSGDTIATATAIDLQDDKADEISGEIGDESRGNLDVDLYEVSVTQGNTLVIQAQEESPRDQIQNVVDELTALSASSDNGHIAEARDEAAAALAALDSDKGPDVDSAMKSLEHAAKALEDAVKHHALGSDVANDLANALAGAARNMAQNALDHAEENGGKSKKIEQSTESLDSGDKDRAADQFDNAIKDYRKAWKKAHQASGKDDASAALNSLKVTIRLFDAAGNELAEVHGQGGIELAWSVTATGTYYVGFSGNDNFDYDPNEEESGTGGSTGCYCGGMWENEPPVITSLQAILVDPDNDIWEISGTVEDEDPGSCTIEFGGILSGHSTTVELDGTFTYRVVIDKDQPGGEGPATATAYDFMSLPSNEWEFTIEQDC